MKIEIFLLFSEASHVDQKTTNLPGHTSASELCQFGAGKLAGPGPFVPEGTLTFSVLLETEFWIKHCASGQQADILVDGVSSKRAEPQRVL